VAASEIEAWLEREVLIRRRAKSMYQGGCCVLLHMLFATVGVTSEGRVIDATRPFAPPRDSLSVVWCANEPVAAAGQSTWLGVCEGFTHGRQGNDPPVTKVLVVATAPVAEDEISSPIGDRFGQGTEFKVVPLLEPTVSRGRSSTRRGSAVLEDPADLGTIDEALRGFDADAVVVVTRISDEASWLASGAVESARDQFTIPVTHLLVA
jgi:hypothetical protein